MRIASVAITLMLLASACTGDEASPEAPALPADATAEAPSPALAAETARPTPRPGPTATPWVAPPPTPTTVRPTVQPPQFTVHLVDIETGEIHQLYSDERQPFPQPAFTPDGDGLLIQRGGPRGGERLAERYTLDARLVETVECLRTDEDGIVEVDGSRVEAVCGEFSPDGSWMAYQVESGETFDVSPVFTVTLREQWLYDLGSGTSRLVQEGLIPCGGCDAFAGPSWSPSGRFYMFAETGGGEDAGRVWVADVATGVTRVIASGGGYNRIGSRPVWSPVADTLLLPGPDGGTIVEDAASGATVLELSDIDWPSVFSDDGRFIVSPRTRQTSSNDTGPRQSETVVVDSASGRAVATLDGGRSPSLDRIDFDVMVAFGEHPAALLEGSDVCSRGTTVLHHPMAAGGSLCLDGVSGAALSPHGDRVAFTRTRGGQREVVVLDVASGEERVLALPEFRSRSGPRLIVWQPEGRYLLVVWPFFFGL